MVSNSLVHERDDEDAAHEGGGQGAHAEYDVAEVVRLQRPLHDPLTLSERNRELCEQYTRNQEVTLINYKK